MTNKLVPDSYQPSEEDLEKLKNSPPNDISLIEEDFNNVCKIQEIYSILDQIKLKSDRKFNTLYIYSNSQIIYNFLFDLNIYYLSYFWEKYPLLEEITILNFYSYKIVYDNSIFIKNDLNQLKMLDDLNTFLDDLTLLINKDEFSILKLLPEVTFYNNNTNTYM